LIHDHAWDLQIIQVIKMALLKSAVRVRKTQFSDVATDVDLFAPIELSTIAHISAVH
jgi:hypothetical protein